MTVRPSNKTEFAAVLASVWILLLAGCGSDAESKRSPTDSDSFALKQIDPSTLPIGDDLPPGVSQTVSVAAPREWNIPSRRNDVVAWFRRWENVQTPMILINEQTLEDADPANINGDNYEVFARQVAERLKSAEREPLEDLVVLQLGDSYFVRYVLEGRIRNQLIERQILETRANGRQYLVELRVHPGKLLEFRDAGYAVAAGLRFKKAAEPASEDQTPPAEEDQ